MLPKTDPFADDESAATNTLPSSSRPAGLSFVPPTEQPIIKSAGTVSQQAPSSTTAFVPPTVAAPPPKPSPFAPVAPSATYVDDTFADAATSATILRFAPCGDSRPALAKFRVESAFKGREWRQVTYFPICTEVLAANDGNFTGPDVRIAPHLRTLDAGVKRNDWDRGSCAVVERRYSEVQALRELLSYQFPHLVIPPLPAKGFSDDVETYFNATDAVNGQRDNLQFFLREIATMPEVMFFSVWTSHFFLEPRDTFETGTLLSMRNALNCFQESSRLVNECSRRKRNIVEDTANIVAAKSTKLVRSVANLLWGSGSSATAEDVVGGTAGNGTDDPSSMRFTTARLSGEALSDAGDWQAVMAILAERRKALRQSARMFEHYLAALTQEKTAVLKVAEATSALEENLRTSSDAQLTIHTRRSSALLEAVARAEGEFAKGKYLNVCLRLFFEGHYVDSALDAIDHVLSLYCCLGSTYKYDANSAAYKEALEYAEHVSKMLRVEFRKFTRDYNQRMRNLLTRQLAVPFSETARALADSTASASTAPV